MTIAPSQLKDRLAALGQEHVFPFLERRDPAAQRRLLAQLEALDLDLLARLRALIGGPDPGGGPSALEPPELFPLERDETHRKRAESAIARGRELFRAGRVGFVLVAGGQGSRLGLDGPKGMFGVGPVTGRSLFEVHARRLLKLREESGVATPWYVMTSPANDAETRGYFEERDFFGLPTEDVFFFAQDMLPALDDEGRMLFAAEDSLFLAPNGHGGCLIGLRNSGALDDMRSRGLQQLSYFQVDNPLVRPVDPLFVGLHDEAGAGMSTKVVAKRGPGEKVGVIGRIDGAMGCIEYSDLSDELREATDDRGELRFRAGNVAVHTIDVDFLAQVTEGQLELPWHVARKSVKCVDAEGRPTESPGYKFETFVFDALARSTASVTLEVDRGLEFSPVKNAEGEDSPASARSDLCALYADWVRRAGRPLPPADAAGNHPVEVDPVYAESAEEFVARADHACDEVDGGHYYG